LVEDKIGPAVLLPHEAK